MPTERGNHRSTQSVSDRAVCAKSHEKPRLKKRPTRPERVPITPYSAELAEPAALAGEGGAR